eukprot:941101-Prorocentrum_minimum.AAC.1
MSLSGGILCTIQERGAHSHAFFFTSTSTPPHSNPPTNTQIDRPGLSPDPEPHPQRNPYLTRTLDPPWVPDPNPNQDPDPKLPVRSW